jgi:hypothetical protein
VHPAPGRDCGNRVEYDFLAGQPAISRLPRLIQRGLVRQDEGCSTVHCVEQRVRDQPGHFHPEPPARCRYSGPGLDRRSRGVKG